MSKKWYTVSPPSPRLVRALEDLIGQANVDCLPFRGVIYIRVTPEEARIILELLQEQHPLTNWTAKLRQF